MERKNLLPPALLERLRRHLYEIDFVYRRLPAVLERAVLATTIQQWGAVFRDQVASTRSHRAELEKLVVFWGQRLRPCACAEVDSLLNEVHHALASRDGTSALDHRLHELFSTLRRIVMDRLGEGIQLAERLGELELARGLEALITGERAQQQMMGAPWEDDLPAVVSAA
ncbi:MAG: DUF892 family protein [Flavobacteriales bacterium]|nr:DUF892 family protein [Flavobacteriales bacterium]